MSRAPEHRRAAAWRRGPFAPRAADASTARRPLPFISTAAPIKAFAGDTLASALARQRRASGRPLVQVSSPARHSRRRVGGAQCAGRRRPRRRAHHPESARHAGRALRRLVAREPEPLAQPRFDVGRVNDGLSPFFPAGFYYKTFMWPRKRLESLYEPFIRRAAGLGRAPRSPDPDRYAQRYAHCDVLVVGAGPAGLAAALAAAEAGARVMLCDEQRNSAAACSSDPQRHRRRAGSRWVEQRIAALRKNPRVTFCPHHGLRLLPAQYDRFEPAAD